MTQQPLVDRFIFTSSLVVNKYKKDNKIYRSYKLYAIPIGTEYRNTEKQLPLTIFKSGIKGGNSYSFQNNRHENEIFKISFKSNFF